MFLFSAMIISTCPATIICIDQFLLILSSFLHKSCLRLRFEQGTKKTIDGFLIAVWELIKNLITFRSEFLIFITSNLFFFLCRFFFIFNFFFLVCSLSFSQMCMLLTIWRIKTDRKRVTTRKQKLTAFNYLPYLIPIRKRIAAEKKHWTEICSKRQCSFSFSNSRKPTLVQLFNSTYFNWIIKLDMEIEIKYVLWL